MRIRAPPFFLHLGGLVASIEPQPDLLAPTTTGGHLIGYARTRIDRSRRRRRIALHEPAPGAKGKVPPGPVWQCSLRNDASDRILSDDEWRDIARNLLDRTGIAPRGDAGACRWVMVRHADDHIHVAAVLVREDTGKKCFPRNDYLRARETCLAAEQTYGLVQTAPVDRTALPAATRAETEKASRRGMGEPARVWLRRAVRTAAVQSRTPETFLTRLRDAGMLVRPRQDPDG
ncbi:MAG: hypothetical protein JO287_05945, partial [Pseudonocardiales bacterium]|nr:hypothetical protein [Pseudonocardiales bacterium]